MRCNLCFNAARAYVKDGEPMSGNSWITLSGDLIDLLLALLPNAQYSKSFGPVYPLGIFCDNDI